MAKVKRKLKVVQDFLEEIELESFERKNENNNKKEALGKKNWEKNMKMTLHRQGWRTERTRNQRPTPCLSSKLWRQLDINRWIR